MRVTRDARAIEYEVVPRHLATTITGVPADELDRCLGQVETVAVVKCVDHLGTRFTVLGDPRGLRNLLRPDEAGPRGELALATGEWPIVLRGWLPDSAPVSRAG